MTNFHSLGRRLSLVGALLLSAPLLVACAPPTIHVAGPDAEINQLVVIGQGEVSAKPDIARVNLGIEINAPTVGEASRQANERMAAILAALKRAGIEDKDVRTSHLSVSFERHMPEPMPYPMPYGYGAPPPMPGGEPLMGAPAPSAPVAPPPAAGKGSRSAPVPGPTAAPPSMAMPMPAPPPMAVPAGFYRVSNTVEVAVRALDRVGPVIDAAMAAGANNVWGVAFGIEETEAIAAKAREEAMADARRRAAALAGLGGVELGQVISIREDFSGGMPPPMPMMAMGMMKEAAPTPIAPGEVAFSTQIRVVYAIKP